METDPTIRNKDNAHRYPRDIDATYILDPSTGIYKPKSVETEQERRRKNAGTEEDTRFFTDPRTDWRPIIIATVISFLTLVLLGFTVHYARQQWIQMGIAATANDISAKAAKSAAITADATLKSSQEQFRNEQRPFVWVNAGILIPGVTNSADLTLPDLVKKNIPLQVSAVAINGGRSPASSFTVTEVTVLFDSPAIVMKKVREYNPIYGPAGSVLMPGAGTYFVTTPPMVLTDQMLKTCMQRSERILRPPRKLFW